MTGALLSLSDGGHLQVADGERDAVRAEGDGLAGPGGEEGRDRVRPPELVRRHPPRC